MSWPRGLDDDLSRRGTWSAIHGLVINKTECVACLVYSKNTSSPLPFFFLDGEQTVKCLGVHFSSNMAYYTHVETVLIKCPKLSIKW